MTNMCSQMTKHCNKVFVHNLACADPQGSQVSHNSKRVYTAVGTLDT